MNQHKINNFISEFKKLYNSNPNNLSYNSWEIKYGPKWIFLYGYISNEVSSKSHILLKIDMDTFDVYTPRDLKPRGNLSSEFGGLELFDDKGIIYNIHVKRKDSRLQELLIQKKRRINNEWKCNSLDYTILNKQKNVFHYSGSCEF